MDTKKTLPINPQLHFLTSIFYMGVSLHTSAVRCTYILLCRSRRYEGVFQVLASATALFESLKLEKGEVELMKL